MTWLVPIVVAVIAAVPGTLIGFGALRQTRTGNGRTAGRYLVKLSEEQDLLQQQVNFATRQIDWLTRAVYRIEGKLP